MSGFKKFNASQSDVQDPVQLQRVINTVQQNTDNALNALKSVTILNGVQYDDLAVNTTLIFNHKLGRKPNGYLVVRKSANTNIWNTTLTADSITLNSSAAVTISIYIY